LPLQHPSHRHRCIWPPLEGVALFGKSVGDCASLIAVAPPVTPLPRRRGRVIARRMISARRI
jgi:hypothetical protein